MIKPNDPRPQKGLWAPGDYLVRCRSCHAFYAGDKFSWHCAPCAYDDGPTRWHHLEETSFPSPSQLPERTNR